VDSGGDFRRLWRAYAVSEFGNAIGLGALPLIAVLALDASDLRVSLLAALAGVAGAVLALPLGPWVEVRRKRPVMIAADLGRFVALASLPVAAAFGVLTYGQLCVVATVQATGVIAFNAASGAHLKALVPAAERGAANGRFEATFWTVYSVGPAVGGLLISAVGATATVAADAVSFLLSALGVRSLRSPEPPPAARTPERHPVARLTAGWRYIFAHRQLRALFLNSQVFGGGVMAASPLLAVRMLRELHFPAWQYGLAMGVPCAGGIVGALLARRLVARHGERPVLLGAGAARALWLGLLPLAPAGPLGLLLVIFSQTMALVCSGAFNPTFGTWRMELTEDGYLSRVLAAWSISNRVVQPVFIAAGGLLAVVAGVRGAMLILAVVLLLGIALLPWRRPVPPQPVSASPAAGAGGWSR